MKVENGSRALPGMPNLPNAQGLRPREKTVSFFLPGEFVILEI